MVKDPRSPKPGSSEPEETLDLLRALARRRAPQGPQNDGPQNDPADPSAPHDEDAKLDALRALAANLDRQLRAPLGAPGGPELAAEDGALPSSSAPHRAAPPPPRERRPSQWAEFLAALPSARMLVPRFHTPQIAFIAIAAATLIAAAMAPYLPRRHGVQGVQGVDVAVPVQPPAQVVPPVGPVGPVAPPTEAQEPPPPDLAALKKAMSDCDASAAQEPDSLNFLVLPLLPRNIGDWRPVALQTIGNAYMLLGAKDGLDGLSNGKLAVRSGRYTFAVLDTASGMTYSWTSATGMSRLARKDSGAMKTLKLGFDFSPAQSGPQWSAEFKRDRGTCYWVVPLVPQ